MFWQWRFLKDQDRNDRGEFTSGDSSLPEKYALPETLPEGKVDWGDSLHMSGVDTEEELRGSIKELSGVTPEQLTGIMTRGTDYTATLTQGQTEPGRSVTLIWDLHDKDGNNVGGVTRSWDRSKFTGELTVHHDLFMLDKEVQGTGLAKSVLGNMMATYQRAGVSAINVDAGHSVGGYAWAKFGFKPDQNQWNILRERIAYRASKEGRNSPAVEKLLQNDSPKTIWKMADMKNGEGKKALLGQGWSGSLRLDDKTGMKRFNTYLAKDRTKKADAEQDMLSEDEILMMLIDEVDGT